jgi:hypothetical protein
MTETKHKDVITPEHFGIPAKFSDHANNYANWRNQELQSKYDDLVSKSKKENEIRTALTKQEPTWKCTGQGLKKYLTQTQYDAQRNEIKTWYEPFSCVECKG